MYFKNYIMKKIYASNIDLNRPVPVIFGSYINALSLVRSFAHRGLKSIVVDNKVGLAFFSKFSVGLLSPSADSEEDAFLSFVFELGKQLPNKGFILCTDDSHLMKLSKNQNSLEEHYVYPMSSWPVINKCIDKNEFHRFILNSDIPRPKAIIAQSIHDAKRQIENLTFPVVVKPSITVGFLEKLKVNGRTIVAKDLKSFLALCKKIIESKCGDIPFIVQEYIPGDASTLYTFTSYSDMNGDVVAYSTGHKIRQYPPDAGTILSGKVIPNHSLVEIGKKVIKEIGYHGIANTEFKLDPRDNKFKIIEINPRPGKWNLSALRTGVNLPYIAYSQVALKENVSKMLLSSEDEIVWLDTLQDMIFSLYGFNSYGYKEYSLSLKAWLSSIKGTRVDCVFDRRDPLPGLIEGPRIIKSWLKRAVLDLLRKKR